jgi:hypothetical protein
VSPQDLSTSRPPVKRAYDVYTVMLFIAAIALIAGCVLLYRELLAYGQFPYWKPTSATSQLPVVPLIPHYWA